MYMVQHKMMNSWRQKEPNLQNANRNTWRRYQKD